MIIHGVCGTRCLRNGGKLIQGVCESLDVLQEFGGQGAAESGGFDWAGHWSNSQSSTLSFFSEVASSFIGRLIFSFQSMLRNAVPRFSVSISNSCCQKTILGHGWKGLEQD
jgi:hypothetical protein